MCGKGELRHVSLVRKQVDVSGLRRLPSRAGEGFAGSLFQYSRVLTGGPWGLFALSFLPCAHFSIMCYSPPSCRDD